MLISSGRGDYFDKDALAAKIYRIDLLFQKFNQAQMVTYGEEVTDQISGGGTVTIKLMVCPAVKLGANGALGTSRIVLEKVEGDESEVAKHRRPYVMVEIVLNRFTLLRKADRLAAAPESAGYVEPFDWRLVVEKVRVSKAAARAKTISNQMAAGQLGSQEPGALFDQQVMSENDVQQYQLQCLDRLEERIRETVKAAFSNPEQIADLAGVPRVNPNMSMDERNLRQEELRNIPSRTEHFNGEGGFASLVTTVKRIVQGPHVMA